MNLLKNLSCAIVAIAGSFSISSTFADIADTPELSPLTDSELRVEAETVQVMYDPHDHQREKALQHRIMQIQMDAQNFVVDPTIVMTIDLVPEPPMPDINSLPLPLQQYVLAIARGLQSSDPREGLYILLEPFGINRNAVNVQIAREQISLGVLENTLRNEAIRLSQQELSSPNSNIR
ncbi:hypothetical protein [Acinetobacter sp.]|jgi:hypothetical protein|uniref:hypothetical protein n=1 Tax=Acinetobacter sp. TaxID=472 RepID=UPI0026477C0A|nr:hypothetical protein [Acinetobacter sp.]MDN5511378.1 hypothetical protein [Acinetobacter sp.]MDN5525743.1 hypothetical protein [Acinetobacter sp.]